MTPLEPADAIGFRYGTQGGTFSVTVHLRDGTSEHFDLTTPGPHGAGAASCFGYCAGASGVLYLTVNAPDHGIDDLTCVGCR